MAATEPSFLVRHEFLIRRLHSLTGIFFGGFVCFHLLVNASVLGGPGAFQNMVHFIHMPGSILPLVEWTLLFAPILFHMIVGLGMTMGMLPNNKNYPYEANWRYTVQRITALYLFFFILYHVFHMHGWFHFDAWLHLAERWGGHVFSPYNASSTLSMALSNTLIALLYALGVLSAAFHFFNGIWTAGITWGIWTRPEAQARALKVCLGAFVVLSVVGLGAIWGARQIDPVEALQVEDRMYEAKVEDGLIPANEHKRYEGELREEAETLSLPSVEVGESEPTSTSGE
ncbi:succinate dehydrogenase cytochrome b558 subunit [Aeoliella mucimassa]|uniref:Succinate dehydrogenase cytochrome b558 subunit n=1 Tax=Aeoliella mucimassa TaxID=2527972 RepID=A0A518ASG2_9BACT|nr:succinate dehydrogenase cytochrome b558 subunit [Aeoliella mucimassa]QDU57665.1 Succinate dehydrogenase cytochrome b558 subunit [Aeoliella mucimassa]